MLIISDVMQSHSEAPFFILGCPRSGTSMLARILNRHQNLAVPYESQIYPFFYPIRRLYGDFSIKSNRNKCIRDILASERMRVDWGGVLTIDSVNKNVTRESFAGIFEAILRAWSQQAGKIRWGEKTPQNVKYINEIEKDFQNAKFIHIVRDGRDIALSLKKAKFGPVNYLNAAYYWKNYLEKVEAFKKIQSRNNYMEIRYEDLVDSPYKVVKEVCIFLHEEFDQDMLNFYKDDVPDNIDITLQKNLSMPINSKNKNKWCTEATKKDIRLFEAIAGEYLKQYGYECVNNDPTVFNFEYFNERYVKNIPLRFIKMSKNKKSQREKLYIWKVLSKLRLNM